MMALKTSIIKCWVFLAFLCPVLSFSQPINNTVHYYKDVKINLNEGINDSSYFEVYVDTSVNFNSSYKTISESALLNSFQLLPNRTYYFKYRLLDKNLLPENWSGVYTLNTFNPETFGIALWLRPDTSLTTNINDEVVSWLDKSNNNNTLSPFSSPSPTFKNNTPFETPCVFFNGTSSYLIGDTINGLNNSSITFLSVSSGVSISNGLELGLFAINNWSDGLWLERGTSTQSFVNWSNGDFLRNPLDLNDAGFNYKILGFRKSFGQSVSLSINGNTTCQSTSNALINTFNNGPIQLGGHSFGNWKGNIGETMLFNTHLNDSVYSICHEYLIEKNFPRFDFGSDIYSCSFPLIVRAKRDYLSSYTWNDMSTLDSLVINSPGTYFVNVNDIFGNSYSDTVRVYQKTSLAPFSYIQNDTIKLCEDSYTSIYANTNQYNYFWSNGDTANKILVNQQGWYNVTISNCIGQAIDDSLFIETIALPNFNLGNDTIICINQSISLENNNPSPNLTFLWSNGDIGSSISPSVSGVYWLKTSTQEGCTFSDTIRVNKDSSLAFTSLGPDTSLCAGNFISLINGNQTGLNYLWNDNSTNSSLVINSSGEYFVTATNSNNCVAEDTINITVVGQAPIAGFENTNTCENTNISFTDTSIALGGGTIINWFWNFGDASATNDTSIVAQPNYTYSDTGSYTINLTLTTNVGCKQNLTKNIYIYPKPIVDFINVIACQNDTAFFSEAINPLGYAITNYQWSFGDGATSAAADPFHIFLQNTNYQVQLIATNSQGCSESITKTITVRDEVSADFNYSNACINVPISFTDNSIAPSPNASNIRNWVFFPGTATGLSATKTFTSAGVYPVQLTVTGFNNCVSSVTKTIEVFLPPDADFTNTTSLY
jgi:PKD repeat protein